VFYSKSLSVPNAIWAFIHQNVVCSYYRDKTNRGWSLSQMSDSYCLFDGMQMIQSNRPYHKVVSSVNNPAPRQIDFDFDFVARALIVDGHCIVAIPSYFNELFEQMVACFASITSINKKIFSFPDKTDGF
jgi:hypothetical protein